VLDGALDGGGENNMTKRVGNTLIIELEEPAKCDLCGAIAELRPYGPNGENICFACGMKNQETTEAKFKERLGYGIGIEKRN